MTEIKFRGKSVEDGETHFGCVVKIGFMWLIHRDYRNMIQVRPDSIEQMVGLDNNDDELYEGDNIIAKHGLVEYSGKVIFDKMSFCIKIDHTSEGVGIHAPDYDIGQTPELNNFDLIFIKNT